MIVEVGPHLHKRMDVILKLSCDCSVESQGSIASLHTELAECQLILDLNCKKRCVALRHTLVLLCKGKMGKPREAVTLLQFFFLVYQHSLCKI